MINYPLPTWLLAGPHLALKVRSKNMASTPLLLSNLGPYHTRGKAAETVALIGRASRPLTTLAADQEAGKWPGRRLSSRSLPGGTGRDTGFTGQKVPQVSLAVAAGLPRMPPCLPGAPFGSCWEGSWLHPAAANVAGATAASRGGTRSLGRTLACGRVSPAPSVVWALLLSLVGKGHGMAWEQRFKPRALIC